ncbi:hypothetical protein AVEN_243798-1 [Araneus ventricosus]|uniref:Uncharacterized protein n=1 Tax=Araneus ventricosus TaxID=182803 RepID=A0A4Y2A5D0_ARAVE|nr:hypothetical protein AVEN_243798-1 [Araneus ventricosus]
MCEQINSHSAEKNKSYFKNQKRSVVFNTILSKVYHRVSSLYASDEHKESYGQLYIFDSSEATEKRSSNNQNCLQHVFEKLDFMLREINPFAQSYLQMHRLVQEHATTSVKIVFLEDKNLDMRRYTAPTLCTEVAAIFVGDNGEPPPTETFVCTQLGIHAKAFHL